MKNRKAMKKKLPIPKAFKIIFKKNFGKKSPKKIVPYNSNKSDIDFEF